MVDFPASHVSKNQAVFPQELRISAPKSCRMRQETHGKSMLGVIFHLTSMSHPKNNHRNPTPFQNPRYRPNQGTSPRRLTHHWGLFDRRSNHSSASGTHVLQKVHRVHGVIDSEGLMGSLFNKSLYLLGLWKKVRNLPYTPICHRRVRKNKLEVAHAKSHHI